MRLSLSEARFLGAAIVLLAWTFSVVVGDVINRDGILYLQAARAFQQHDIRAAFEIYPWPFYSIAIALLSNVSGLSLPHAAYCLNGILLWLMADSSIRIYHEIEPSAKLKWLPMILLLSLGQVAKRLEVVRDWGFWGFMLLAFCYLIIFRNRRPLSAAFGWQVAGLLALVFRLEALVYLILAPLYLLFGRETWKARMTVYLQANSLLLIAAVGLLFAALLWPELVFYRPSKLWRYLDIVYLWNTFSAHADVFADQLLTKYSQKHAPWMLATGILVAVVMQIATTLGWVYLAIIGYGAYRFGFPSGISYRLIGYLFLIGFCLLAVFFTREMVIVTRYAVLSALLLIPFVSHYLEKLLLNRGQYARVVKGVAALAVFVLFVDSIIVTTDSKISMKETGVWVQQHLPQASKISASDPRLLYYSGRGVSFDPKESDVMNPENMDESRLEGFDYFLFRSTKLVPSLKRWEMRGLISPVAEFSGKERDRTVVYRITGAN
jgi:hypothetical protein